MRSKKYKDVGNCKKKQLNSIASKKIGNIIHLAVLAISILLVATTVLVGMKDNFDGFNINKINAEKTKLEQNSITKCHSNLLVINTGTKPTNSNNNSIRDLVVVHFDDNHKMIDSVSLVYDSYVKIGNTNSYGKLVNIYNKKNVNNLLLSINNSTDLNVKSYVVINDEIIMKLVDVLQSIRVNIDKDDIAPLNSNMKRLAKEYDVNKYIKIKKDGVQNINGLQAAAYAEISVGKYGNICRDRHLRRIVNKIVLGLGKCSLSDLERAKQIVSLNSDSEIKSDYLIEMIARFQTYKMGVKIKWPISYHRYTYNGTRYVFPITLLSNSNTMQNIYFVNNTYRPSSALKSQSRHIESVVEAIKKAKAEAKAKKAAEEAAKKAAEEKAKQEANNTDNNSSSNTNNNSSGDNNNSSNTNNNSNNSNNNSSSDDNVIDNGGSSSGGDSSSGDDSGFDLFN